MKNHQTLAGHKVKFPNRVSVSDEVIVNVLDNMGLPTNDVNISAVGIILFQISK